MPLNTLIAFQWSDFTIGVLMVVVLMGLLVVPFLIKANRDGKRQLGPVRWLQRGGGVKLGPLPPIGGMAKSPARLGVTLKSCVMLVVTLPLIICIEVC